MAEPTATPAAAPETQAMARFRLRIRAGHAAQAQAQIANVWPVLKPHADAALLQTLQAEGLMPAASNDSKARPGLAASRPQRETNA